MKYRGGFTMVEVAATGLVLGGLLAATLPLARAAQDESRQKVSQNNLRQILIARAAYGVDHAGQVPMRGARYSGGQLSGWDTWHFGGKNCDLYWSTANGGLFDESAFSRPLNPYLMAFDVPQPAGYLNAGSGATWNFIHGTPSIQQRAALQIPVFRSPGDRGTIQRNWPTPTVGVSAYNDVGTSYFANMKWWDQPGAPFNFTQRFNEGVGRIMLAVMQPPPSQFVWIHDQTGDRVPYGGPNLTVQGEFGGVNKSMLGFIDGRAEYVQLTAGAASGPGYNFWP